MNVKLSTFRFETKILLIEGLGFNSFIHVSNFNLLSFLGIHGFQATNFTSCKTQCWNQEDSELCYRKPGLSRHVFIWIKTSSVKRNRSNGYFGGFTYSNSGQSFDLSQLTSSRIAAGAWCGACFFLVQIYCSTLTSHLTYPNQRPIANSIHEIAHTPGVSFSTERGIDSILQVTHFLQLLIWGIDFHFNVATMNRVLKMGSWNF